MTKLVLGKFIESPSIDLDASDGDVVVWGVGDCWVRFKDEWVKIPIRLNLDEPLCLIKRGKSKYTLNDIVVELNEVKTMNDDGTATIHYNVVAAAFREPEAKPKHEPVNLERYAAIEEFGLF